VEEEDVGERVVHVLDDALPVGDLAGLVELGLYKSSAKLLREGTTSWEGVAP